MRGEHAAYLPGQGGIMRRGLRKNGGALIG
jgi:hypothetical protein